MRNCSMMCFKYPRACCRRGDDVLKIARIPKTLPPTPRESASGLPRPTTSSSFLAVALQQPPSSSSPAASLPPPSPSSTPSFPSSSPHSSSSFQMASAAYFPCPNGGCAAKQSKGDVQHHPSSSHCFGEMRGGIGGMCGDDSLLGDDFSSSPSLSSKHHS
jgi:hypothetical protein